MLALLPGVKDFRGKSVSVPVIPKSLCRVSQEGRSDRSRSQRGFEVGAAQSTANPVTPSQSMTASSSTSQSTPEPRGSKDRRIAIPEHRIALQAVEEARETLQAVGGHEFSPARIAPHSPA